MQEGQFKSDHELAHERYRKLLFLMLGAMLVIAVIGGCGGHLVLDANDWNPRQVPKLLVLAPTIAASLAVGLPLYFIRKRWFPTRESLIAASKREPPES